ncbi:MAG: exodeoxyribonuclease VII small subunit [Bacteroidales bacterium]|nr:exodeoxyribonuclease VII small subunit [Bacteroidales bacterium]
MAAAKKLSYNEAVARLDAIIAETESGTLDIDLLATRLKEAQELIALCQAKLFAAKTTVDRLLDTSNTEP